MPENKIYEDIKLRLEKLNIYEVRQVARAVGVHRPADGKKSRVISAILDIASGKVMPAAQSLRGAPPKSSVCDEMLVADIKTCREYSLALFGESVQEKPVSTVHDSASSESSAFSGILYNDGKKYFIRENESGKNIFVHESFINRFDLREGDLIAGERRRKSAEDSYGLSGITYINGNLPETAPRRDFNKLTHTYPAVKLNLSVNGGGAALKMIDLFSPLALGQRAVVCSSAKCGKTTILKQIAAAICANYSNIKVLAALIDERPEDLTDFKRSVEGCEVYCTSFDMPAESHMREVRLCFERAKRIAECGGNAVILFDGISRLIRSLSFGARSGFNEFSAVEEVKKLLYCACNAEEGGSLTVVSTLSSDGLNTNEAAVYGEFKQLANMVITLSRELAEKRIFPAIAPAESYADREETFLSDVEIKAAAALRELPAEQVVKIFETSNADEIIAKYGN